MKRMLLLTLIFLLSTCSVAAKTVTVEEGVYRLPVQLSGAHLELRDLQDTTLDFSGSTLLFQSREGVGIRFINCQNVTVKNVRLDYETPTNWQATVTAIDPEGFFLDFIIPSGYPDVGGGADDNLLYFFDGATGAYLQEGSFNSLTVSRLERVGDRRYRLYSATAARIPTLKVGDILTWGNRLSAGNAIELRDSSSCRLENVQIYAGQVGIFCADGYGDHTFDNVQIRPGPRPLGATADRVMSTIADGMHLQRMEHGITLQDSYVAACGDDGLNFYGGFSRVAKTGTPFTLVCTLSARPEAGDTLRFYTEEGVFAGWSTIKTIAPAEPDPTVDTDRFIAKKAYAVTLSAPLLLQKGMWVTNADKNCSDFSVTNTTYQDLHGRGILVKGSNGRIANCTFSNVGIAGILMTPEFDILEADYVRDVTVENNTFINCGLRGGAIVIDGGEGNHERISILNNTFLQSPVFDVSARCVTDLILQDGIKNKSE